MERRNCCEVILKMIDIIPTENEEFIKHLVKDFESAQYNAPEDNIQWIRTSYTLAEHIPIPEKDWEFKLLSLWTVKPIEEIKRMVEEGKNEI